MIHYLIYWKPATVARYRKNNDTVYHTASDQYDRVSVGDMLWIVTSKERNSLVLMGRQRVDRMMNQTQADAHFDSPTNWRSKHHVIAEEPEEIVNLTISHIAQQLRFDGTVESLPTGFTGQHLQRMRRLKPSAIKLLEHLWMQRFDTV